jgi:hypothetical protein
MPKNIMSVMQRRSKPDAENDGWRVERKQRQSSVNGARNRITVTLKQPRHEQ